MNDDFVEGEVFPSELPATDILSKVQWRTEDRRLIYVKDMEDKHIRNCALFLVAMGYRRCIAPENIRISWLRIFKMEWDRRFEEKRKGMKKFRVYADEFDDQKSLMR